MSVARLCDAVVKLGGRVLEGVESVSFEPGRITFGVDLAWGPNRHDRRKAAALARRRAPIARSRPRAR